MHQRSNQRREPKALDNNRPKITNPPIWNIPHDAQNKKQIEFNISKRLHNLIDLEMFILHPRLIVPQPLNRPPPFPLTQQGRCDGGIREEDK